MTVDGDATANPFSVSANRFRLLTQIAAAIVAVGGVLVLAGWMLGNPLLTSFIPGLVAMNPATAVLFVLTATAIWLHANDRNRFRTPALLRGALGGIILAGGLLTVIGYVLGWNAGIDRILFADALGDNRMAPNTAANFAVVGLALLTLETRWSDKWPSQALDLLVMGGALMSLLGYGYGANNLFGIGDYIPMALNTAVLFAVTGLGLLCIRGEGGLFAILVGQQPGSAMARNLLPIAVIVPCTLGFLRVLGQRAGWYDSEFGAAFMVLATIVLLVAAIVHTSRALNHSDIERNSAARALQQAHLELQSQTQVLQSILDSMGDGVVVADSSGKFTQFNPAAERILGIGPSDVEPEEWTTQYGCYLSDGHTPYPPRLLPLARTLRGETVDEDELFIRNAAVVEGVWISCTGRPLGKAGGESRGGVVVFRDISDRKRAEEALRKSNEELEWRVAERTKKLADANRDLAQQNQENEMFVYSVSHDLRSPLVNLQGFSKELAAVVADLKALVEQETVPETIRKEATALLEGDMRQSLRFIQTAVSRLGNIIDALLRLSRVGRIEYQCGEVDVHPLVMRVVESMGSALFDAGVAVRVLSLPPCQGDPTALEQLFANLISNAVKYRDPSRESTIEVSVVGDQTTGADAAAWTYYVKDNGLGIPAAHQEKIFQAFKRAHPHIGSGEGMGLAIVRRIAERLGGNTWVESQEGQGSTFFVTLPAGAAQRATEPTILDAQRGETKHGSGTPGDLVGGRR